MSKNRKYTLEFKEQAVRLAKQLGSNRAAAVKLGVSDGNSHSWVRKFGKPVARPDASGESPDAELKRLQKENDELQKVNYILKRAAAFFSQDHLK